MSEHPNVENLGDAWSLFRHHLANRGAGARILLNRNAVDEAAEQWQELAEKLRGVLEALPEILNASNRAPLEEILAMVEQGSPADLDAILEKEHENNPKAEAFARQLAELMADQS